MPLKLQKHLPPDYTHEALNQRGLLEAYHSRPAYQQNDYIGWITHAKPYNKAEALEPNAGRTRRWKIVDEDGMKIKQYSLELIFSRLQERNKR